MNRKTIAKTAGIIIASVLIIFGFLYINSTINKNRNGSFKPTEDCGNYAYQVEELYTDGDDICIKGWFFELNSVKNRYREVNKDAVLGIILFNPNAENKDSAKENGTLSGSSFKVERNTRNDINEYFKCEYDYSGCGFTARIPKTEIDLENGEYQIIFKPDEAEDAGIYSNTYIVKGAVKYVNPKDMILLDVEGTDLQEIVENGYCLVSYPEFHMSVYQFGKTLYWITDDSYLFEPDGTTHIEYQLETTQFDKLPQNRIEKGTFWSSIGGEFEDYEITGQINTGKYRVSARDIPSEYSVTCLLTGHYTNGDWIWSRFFRPVFLYK